MRPALHGRPWLSALLVGWMGCSTLAATFKDPGGLPDERGIGLPCVTQPSGFAGGDGTPENPYQVCLPEHLDNVRNHLTAHFVQTADIEIGGSGSFDRIGSEIEPFDGSFDGACFIISGLRIQASSTSWMALIAQTGLSGVLRNMHVTGLIEGGDIVGGIVAENRGLVEYCAFVGLVGGGDRVGGISGTNRGQITQSWTAGDVHAVSNAGGLTGISIPGSSIVACYSNSSVAADELLAGGLVGYLDGAGMPTVVDACYSSGAVVAPSSFAVGGLIGFTNGAPTVSASFWDVETSGQATSAGGVGRTTAEMQVQATFDPPWDFTTIWTISEGNDYPRLRQVPHTFGSTDCNGNGVPDACDPGPPAAMVVSAGSRRNCDLPLVPARQSDPRQGGVTQVRITFDAPPGCRGAEAVTLEQATCALPAFAPYAGAADVLVSTVGSELVIAFAPALENGRTYRILLGPEVTSVAGQFVEVRGLVGDVNSDGRVSGTDRSVLVGAWTGSGFTCATDANGDGRTNATDRSIVVSAWTGSVNCAP